MIRTTYRTCRAAAMAVLLAWATLGWGQLAAAQNLPASGALTPAQGAKVVEDYINRLTTLQADFSQQVSGEAWLSEGTLTLKRPRQFLWQYETPNRQKLVGTGSAVYFVDLEGPRRPGQAGESIGQVTQLPLNSGLGRIFGPKQLNLAKEGLVVESARALPERVVVRLRLATRADDATGLKAVTLTFARRPALQLQRIEAVDALNVTTTIRLSNVRTGQPVPVRLFAFTPPVMQNEF